MCIANVAIPYTIIQAGIYVKVMSIADKSHVAPRIPKGFKSIFIKMPL